MSRKEQKKRLLARLDTPEKHWKFSVADLQGRRFWDDYMRAYEKAIQATAPRTTARALMPADNKWFTRLVVAAAIVLTVEKLDLAYPEVSAEMKQQLFAARAAKEA
jgi:polyphosphate kinase 2 (PPK2 family)